MPSSSKRSSAPQVHDRLELFFTASSSHSQRASESEKLRQQLRRSQQLRRYNEHKSTAASLATTLSLPARAPTIPMLFYFFTAGACAWLIPVAMITSTFFIEQTCGVIDDAAVVSSSASPLTSPPARLTLPLWYSKFACNMLPSIYTLICILSMTISIMSSRRIRSFTRGIRRIYRSVSPTSTSGCKILNNPTDTTTTKGVIYSIPFALCQTIALVPLIPVTAPATKPIDDTVTFVTTTCIAVFGGFVAGGFQSIINSVLNMFEGTRSNVIYYVGFLGMGAFMMIGSPSINIVSWFALAVFVIVLHCIVAVLFYYSKEHQCAVPTFNRLKQMKRSFSKEQDLITAINNCHAKMTINTLYSKTPAVPAPISPTPETLTVKLDTIPTLVIEAAEVAASSTSSTTATTATTTADDDCCAPITDDAPAALPFPDWSFNKVARTITLIQFLNNALTFTVFPGIVSVTPAMDSPMHAFEFMLCFFLTSFIATIVLFLLPIELKTRRIVLILSIVFVCLRVVNTGAFIAVYIYIPNLSAILAITAMHAFFHAISYWLSERYLSLMKCAQKNSICLVKTHGAMVTGLLVNCIITILVIFYK